MAAIYGTTNTGKEPLAHLLSIQLVDAMIVPSVVKAVLMR